MFIQEKKNITSNWFKDLRDLICSEFEKIEEEYLNSKPQHLINFQEPQKFIRNKWQRQNSFGEGLDGKCGGGEMSIMKGNVFEKVGVNISTVFGEFSEEFRKQIPNTKNSGKFFATGISLVAHMSSPLVPAVHMNTRFIVTEKSWFGGGADLNPMYESEEDTQDFHLAFKKACDQYDSSLSAEELKNILKNNLGNSYTEEKNSYSKFKKWCDEYFFIKHRGVSRGVGGIFYDYLNSENFDQNFNSGNDNELNTDSAKKYDQNFEKDFNFTKNVGLAFLEIFPKLVRRNMFKTYNDEHREHQLKKRGLYTEFNLLYDRGTKFGLMTGGNVEAILMSLPPIAKWS